MRRSVLVALLGLISSLSVTVAFARDPLKIESDEPPDIDTVQQDKEKIDAYLGEAQCGGWNMDESVVGKIATVTGAPGRVGEWDSSLLSGMSTRVDMNGDDNADNDFQFPGSTTGFTTDCWSGTDKIQKEVWRSGGAHADEIIRKTIIFPYPKFEDPACRWRWKDGGNFLEKAKDIPLKDTYSPYPNFEEMTDKPGDRQSETTCTNFCTYLNSFQYKDCKETGNGIDLVSGATYTTCTKWINRYICSNQEVQNENQACVAGSSEMGNAKACVGAECRCDQGGGPAANGCVYDPEGGSYYSYYRNYTAKVQRDPVPSDGPADNTLGGEDISVACYGFYKEFDPKFQQTHEEDRRCVIDVDVSGMRQSQRGKGEYGKNSDVIDVDPVDVDNQRVKDDSQKDLWFQKTGWGISFLNEEIFEDEYDKDLSNVYLDTDNLDKAKMTASWPVNNQGQSPHLSIADLLRSFDDTGSGRILSNWWQKQQTEMSVIEHPTVVRILLPPSYAFGVDSEDPLLTRLEQNTTDKTLDERSRRIDIQVGAQEDILGQALRVIDHSFLVHLTEEPIPVLVPLGDPVEYRANADAWCKWYMKKELKPNCDDAPQNVKNLIRQLLTYADEIEHVRELRASLASYAGKIMQLQAKLIQPINDWMAKNLSAYEDYIRSQKDLDGQLIDIWRDTQTHMSTFHDQTNLPWCMNQRFTMPIYSLLDEWLRSRSKNGALSAEGLPNITIPRPADLTLDFSSIAYMTGSLALPVLKPIQVRINIPKPPDVDKIVSLPDLPSIEEIRNAFSDSISDLPEVGTGAVYPPLALPILDTEKMSDVIRTVDDIQNTVREMNSRYEKFWQSIGPLNRPCTSSDQCSINRNENCDNGICRDTSGDSLQDRKANLECKQWDDQTCQHVEMDLMERLQRINSRKLIFLKEDLQSTGIPRLSGDVCLPHDTTCLLLHGEVSPARYQWQIDSPRSMPDLAGDAKKVIRDKTLPEPVGGIDPKKFPPYDTNTNDLLPIYDVPRAIDLHIPKK